MHRRTDVNIHIHTSMRADTHVHIHMYALTRVAIGSALLVPVLDASLVVTVARQCPRASRRQHEVLQRRPETHACRIRKVRDLRHTQTCTGERAFVQGDLCEQARAGRIHFNRQSLTWTVHENSDFCYCAHTWSLQRACYQQTSTKKCACVLCCIHPSTHQQKHR